MKEGARSSGNTEIGTTDLPGESKKALLAEDVVLFHF